MALTYLSGDTEMGRRKRPSKAARKEKRGKGKAERKAKRKDRPKRIAKISLVTVRGAFLTVVTLNLLKTGTKLARVWNKKGGKEKLLSWWKKMGGDGAKLKKAIAKGSKQTIAGHIVGVATSVLIANATAALIALVPILKSFKAEGSEEEAAEYDKGIEEGKKELATNPDFEKSTAIMPEDEDVARLKEPPPGAEGKPPTTGLNLSTNPLSICFYILMVVFALNLESPLMVSIATPFVFYALLGFLIIPFSEFGIAGERVSRFARSYFDIPVKLFFSITNIFSHGKAN